MHYPPERGAFPATFKGRLMSPPFVRISTTWLMTSRVAGRSSRPVVGGGTASGPLATRPCVGMLGSSSRVGIVPPGFVLPQRGAGGDGPGGPAAQPAVDPNGPPLYRSRPPAKAKVPGGKGPPFYRSQPPAKAKGTGSKGRGKGGQGEGKGGRKGAHPGRGEYSRYAGYSEATSGAAPSAHFQESVPKGQAKGAPPEEPPSTTGDADESGRTAEATTEFIPTAISQLSPAEIEEERRIAEASYEFLDAFPAPSLQPAAPRPAPATSTWKPQLPTVTPSARSAETLAAELPSQGEADASAEAAEPGANQAPPAYAEGEPPTIGSYPPLHQPSAVTVIGHSPPPPPLPTALVGRHVTAHGSELPSIEGESGHVTEYGPFSERYHVQLNNGHVYHLASRHLHLTQAPAKAVQLPPMQTHPLPATVTPKYKPRRCASTDPSRQRTNLSSGHTRQLRARPEARSRNPHRPRRDPCLPNRPRSKARRRRFPRRGSFEASHTRRSSGRFRRALGARRPLRRDRLRPDARRFITR